LRLARDRKRPLPNLPLRHLSIRVPWHDNGWNGTICNHAKGNAACLVIRNVREKRNDDQEESDGGQSIEDLSKNRWPACMGERGTFMSPFAFDRIVKHPYVGFSEEHMVNGPATFHHPAYCAATIPFRWMSRSDAWTLAEQAELDVDPNREPVHGWLEKNAWVQNQTNQGALLDGFFQRDRARTLALFLLRKADPALRRARPCPDRSRAGHKRRATRPVCVHTLRRPSLVCLGSGNFALGPPRRIGRLSAPVPRDPRPSRRRRVAQSQ
jgi:hypothetical protein